MNKLFDFNHDGCTDIAEEIPGFAAVEELFGAAEENKKTWCSETEDGEERLEELHARCDELDAQLNEMKNNPPDNSNIELYDNWKKKVEEAEGEMDNVIAEISALEEEIEM